MTRQKKIEALKAFASGKARLEDVLFNEDFNMVIEYSNNGNPMYIGSYVYTEAEFTELLKRHNKTFAQLQCVISLEAALPVNFVRLQRHADCLRIRQ